MKLSLTTFSERNICFLYILLFSIFKTYVQDHFLDTLDNLSVFKDWSYVKKKDENSEKHIEKLFIENPNIKIVY